jgi:DNA-binding IclR family transcriptional regulator
MQGRTAVDGGQHQSVARIELVLSVLARAPEEGLRLIDVCAATGLSRTAAHRILNGLVTYRLADVDPSLNRYALGLKIFSWASAAANRFGLNRMLSPALARLADRFEDAVYLILRNEDRAVCIERAEGAFPIKSLAFNVGDSRPLGVGAGSLAILAALEDAEVDRILAKDRRARLPYKLADQEIRKLVKDARQQGHAFVEGRIVPGIATVGVPILLEDGAPIGALSVSAIDARMTRPRRMEIAGAIQREIRSVAEAFGGLLTPANRKALLAGSMERRIP